MSASLPFRPEQSRGASEIAKPLSGARNDRKGKVMRNDNITVPLTL